MSMHDNLATVKALFAAIEACDETRFRSFFTENSVFKNGPSPPVTGPDAIWHEFSAVLKASRRVEWVVPNLAVTESGTVLSERIDRYWIDGKWVEFRLMGACEIKAGKISAWREYIDMQEARETMDRAGIALG